MTDTIDLPLTVVLEASEDQLERRTTNVESWYLDSQYLVPTGPSDTRPVLGVWDVRPLDRSSGRVPLPTEPPESGREPSLDREEQE